MKLLAESFTIYLTDHLPRERETCHWLTLIQITDLVFPSFHCLSKLDTHATFVQCPFFYRMEGNFGGGKRWRIWRMTINSPKFLPPIFPSNVIKNVIDASLPLS